MSLPRTFRLRSGRWESVPARPKAAGGRTLPQPPRPRQGQPPAPPRENRSCRPARPNDLMRVSAADHHGPAARWLMRIAPFVVGSLGILAGLAGTGSAAAQPV